MDWRDQLEAIMLDHLEGATGLGTATAAMLGDFLANDTSTSVQELASRLQLIAQQVLTAQSGMAILVNLFNQVFSALDSASEVGLIREQIRDQLRSTQENLVAQQQGCARLAVALLAPDSVIMTHSASSTVLATLLRAAAEGYNPRVIVTESRPLCEGRRLAEQLDASGIDVTLIVDAAIYANMEKVDVIFLGVDSLTTDGVISKIGSAAIAVCARTLGIPCYFLGDLGRVWPATLGRQPIHERATGEVWPDAPGRVKVQNRYYDLTPWLAICGIVTEEGLLSPDRVQCLCQERKVHPLLEATMAVVRSSII